MRVWSGYVEASERGLYEGTPDKDYLYAPSSCHLPLSHGLPALQAPLEENRSHRSLRNLPS